MSAIQSDPTPHVEPNLGASEVTEIMTTREVVEDGSMTTERIETAPGPQRQDLTQALCRFTKIASGVIQSSDTALTNLLGTFNPTLTLLSNTYIANKLTNVGAIRGTVEIVMTVTVPSNAYGSYLLQGLCEGQQSFPSGTFYETGGGAADTMYTATQDVHGFIDVTKSNSVKLQLPFVYPIDTLFLTNSAVSLGDSWRLCLWAVSPIQNSMNTDTISGTFNIYARFCEDYEISLPVLHVKGLQEKFAKAKGMVDDARKSKIASKTAGSVAKAAATIGTMIPMLAPLAGPVAAGAAAFAGIADWMGFTKEAKPQEPLAIMQRPSTNLSTVDGFDTSEIAALYNTNATTIDATVGGGTAEDEASFASLFARWTIVDTFTWSTATLAGNNIRTIPVSPFHCANTLGAYYPTTAGYVGMPFKYWRGGMEYKIVVAASSYHRGMLQVIWDFDAYQTATATDPTNILHNVILDAASDNSVTLKVGYNSPLIALQNTGLFTSSAFSTADYTNSNGALYFRVANQLQAVGGAAPATIIVLARACPDMRFGVPRNKCKFISDTSAIVNGPSVCWQLQAGALGDDDRTEDESLTLVGGDSTVSYPVGAVLFGEEFASVRALAQRFSRIFVSTTSTGATEVWPFPHFYPAPATYGGQVVSNALSTGTNPFWTWSGHYSALFVGVRGSTRYKVLSAVSGTTLSQTAMVAVEDSDGTTNFDVFNVGSAGGLEQAGINTSCVSNNASGGSEFQLPNYMSQKFWPFRFAGLNDGSSNYRRDLLIIGPNTAATYFHVYQAAGADLALIKFRRVPACISAVL